MVRGDITQSAGNGKKIDTFYYHIDQLGEDDHFERGRVEIDVFMAKKFQGEGTKKETTSVWFTAICKAAKCEHGGTDLDAVIKALRSDLDKHYRIKWERWFYVRIDATRIYDGSGAGLELTWKEIDRGVTIDGQILLRRYNMHADWAHRWEIKPWPDQFKDRDGRVVACIPNTPENEAALQAFAAKITEMRKALAEFVRPENINETIKAISNGQALLGRVV